MTEINEKLSQKLIALINSQDPNFWFHYVSKSDPKEIKKVIKEDYIVSRNLNIHIDIYNREEDAPTVIFIHGTSTYSRMYSDFLYQLWQKGFRIIALDLQGHGRSEGVRGDFTIGQLVENIYDVTSHVIDKYKTKIGIMGSSLGGILSLYSAANDPRINSCVCHNAAILNKYAQKKVPVIKGIYKVVKPLIPLAAKMMPNRKFSVFAYLDIDKLVLLPEMEFIKEIWLEDKLMSTKYTLRAIRSQMNAPLKIPIGEIETPIMIINGDNDYLFSVDYMTEIYNWITSKKKLEIIPNSGHMILLENIEESVKKTASWFNQTLK